MTERITQKFALTAPDGTYTDSAVRGLRLRVRGDGKYRFWIFRRTIQHKVHEVQLGKPSQHDIAKIRLDAVRLANLPSVEFLSVLAQKSSGESLEKLATINTLLDHNIGTGQRTFEECSAIYFVWLEQSGRVQNRRFKIVLSYANRFILPVLGEKYVNDITANDVARLVFNISEMTTRRSVLWLIHQIFDYAKARNFVQGDNPAARNGPLKFLLPVDNYVGGHFGALSVEKLPHFFAALMRGPRSKSRLSYIFAILTTTRAHTAVTARWEQIDFEKKLWSIPPSQLKISKNGALFVPLSQQVIDLLKSIPGNREGYVFPGKTADNHLVITSSFITRTVPGEWLDERQTLEKGKPVPATLHGISRATFRTWAQDDKLGNDKRFDPLTAELCLHHKLRDAHNGAYERNVWMDRRRELLQAWADYCFSLVPEELYPVPIDEDDSE